MIRPFLLSSFVLAAASAGLTAVCWPGIAPRGLLWEEEIPALLMRMPFAVVAVAALLASVAFVMRRLRARRALWLSQGRWLSAGALLLGSMLLLGPSGGFHHMFRFGVLGYMIVDCDSPPEELPIPLGRCGIRGSVFLLVVTLALWVALVLLSLWWQSARAHRIEASTR